MTKQELRSLNKGNLFNLLYVIENEYGLVKIGITDNPKSRFNTIQNTSGVPIINYYLSKPMKNNYDVEQRCHEYFKKYNTFGEWYKGITFKEVLNQIKMIENDMAEYYQDDLYVKNTQHFNRVDTSVFFDVFMDLYEFDKLMSGNYFSDDKIIFIDKLLDSYDEMSTSEDFSKTDRALVLAPISMSIEKEFMNILKYIGGHTLLQNRKYYNFFNDYFGIEKASNKNIHQKRYVILDI